jgi:hypothetical protein
MTMPMIEKIYNTAALQPFLHKDCCENEVCVTFDEALLLENYVVIKVDDYYNSLHLEKTPPSPDCLIVRKCENEGFGLTIVELKAISTAQNFDLANMKNKFSTCIDDFIGDKFNDLLLQDYKDIKLYFVSNIEVYKRDLGLKLEILINTKFEYNGKKHMIQARMPNPTIKRCY